MEQTAAGASILWRIYSLGSGCRACCRRPCRSSRSLPMDLMRSRSPSRTSTVPWVRDCSTRRRAALSIESPTIRWRFDADPAEFRLAAEGCGSGWPVCMTDGRVSSSAVDALPHQIRAVYGELLPRTPLRFLLADDPGPGRPSWRGSTQGADAAG